MEMPPPPTTTKAKPEEQVEAVRSSKRRSALLRSPSSFSNIADGSGGSRKKYRAVPTESMPEYQKLWPEPFLLERESAPAVEYGQEVGRDQSTRADLAYLRAIASMDNREQIESVLKESVAVLDKAHATKKARTKQGVPVAVLGFGSIAIVTVDKDRATKKARSKKVDSVAVVGFDTIAVLGVLDDAKEEPR